MSAVVDAAARDARVAALLDAHGGDADAALLACLVAIDKLAADLGRVSVQTSYGYSRGRTRPHAGVQAGTAIEQREPLDV